jgi:hypothetical protein
MRQDPVPATAAPQATPPAAPPATAAQELVQVSPREVYVAQRASRDEVRSQHSRLLEQRRSIAERLRDGGNVMGADRTGLEARLQELDARILVMEKQLAQADAQVAAAAAVPGATQGAGGSGPSGPPEEAIVFGGLIGLAAVLPLSIALAKRIMRGGAPALPKRALSELDTRLDRLEQAVDSVAVEVERIGEGQRFVTNLFIESGAPLALGAGPMAPVAQPQREGQGAERRDAAR